MSQTSLMPTSQTIKSNTLEQCQQAVIGLSHSTTNGDDMFSILDIESQELNTCWVR